jgi:hypothetical protein
MAKASVTFTDGENNSVDIATEIFVDDEDHPDDRPIASSAVLLAVTVSALNSSGMLLPLATITAQSLANKEAPAERLSKLIEIKDDG